MRTKTLCTSQDIGYQWSLFLSKENVKLCLILSVKVRPVFQKRFPHLYKDFCNNFRRQRTHTVTNEHACLVEGGRWRVCYGVEGRAGNVVEAAGLKTDMGTVTAGTGVVGMDTMVGGARIGTAVVLSTWEPLHQFL